MKMDYRKLICLFILFALFLAVLSSCFIQNIEKETQKANTPVTDTTKETKTDDPVTDDPVTDDPVTDDPVTDDPVTDDPVTDDPTGNELEPDFEHFLTLVSVSSPVSVNETATVVIQGKPNTEYKIRVYYSTTVSTAAGLQNQVSDKNGKVVWNWKIGGKTKPGSHKIVISGGGETITTQFVTT